MTKWRRFWCLLLGGHYPWGSLMAGRWIRCSGCAAVYDYKTGELP